MNVRFLLVTVAVSLLFQGAWGQDSCGHYFYTHPEYGSQSTFNPISVLLNGGYDIVQTGMYDSYLFQIPYRKSARNVLDNIYHPMGQISRHGWGEFIGTEVLPTSFRIDRSQYLPNYTLHVIGGGTTYRMMREWNETYNVPCPVLSAVLFTTAYNFLNEVLENGSYTGVNVDPIADIWIFNPLGMLLFSSNRVARFFSESIQVCDWSSMPFIDPVNGKIDNVSQNWAVKIPLPLVDRVKLFVYLGMSEVVGVSYALKNDLSLSGGGGFSVANITAADSGSATGRIMTINYSWNAGLFLDKNNSLLFSLLLSNSSVYKIRANLYPLPDLHWGSFRPGFFAALGRKNDVVIGITANILPLSFSIRSY